MRMHGHRVIFVDIFAKINLILSDANNDTVSSAVTETNQYMFYDKKRVILPESGKLSLFLLKVSNGSAIMHTIIMQILEVHCQK